MHVPALLISVIQILAFVAVIGLLLVDWGQTVTISRNPDRWYETNEFLGVHPSVRKDNVWFGTWIAIGCVAAVVLWRLPTWFFIAAVMGAVCEAPFVVGNFKLGIRPWARATSSTEVRM